MTIIYHMRSLVLSPSGGDRRLPAVDLHGVGVAAATTVAVAHAAMQVPRDTFHPAMTAGIPAPEVMVPNTAPPAA